MKMVFRTNNPENFILKQNRFNVHFAEILTD